MTDSFDITATMAPPHDAWAQLADHAQASGMDPADYFRALVTAHIGGGVAYPRHVVDHLAGVENNLRQLVEIARDHPTTAQTSFDRALRMIEECMANTARSYMAYFGPKPK